MAFGKIDFSDLTPTQQSKLKPFMTIAKSVEDAIAMAKQNGAWTKADDAALETINGNANWGVGEKLDFKHSKNFAQLNQAEVKKDRAKNPQKYEPKFCTMKSGRYIVYQKDPKTGKETYKFYAKDGTQIKEKYFRQKEKIAPARLVAYNATKGKVEFPFPDEMKESNYRGFTDANGNFSIENTFSTLLGYAGAATGIMGMCSTEQTVEVGIELKSLADAINALNEKQDVSNAILIQLLEQSIKNGDSLQDIKNTCGNYLPQILTAVVDNNALLKKIQNDMNMGFDDLLEAVYNVENAVKDLTALIKALPASIKSEFQGDLNMIINLIKSGNADISSIRGSLEALAGKIDAILNQVTINGATQQDIKALLEKIRNTQTKDSEKLLLMLQLLKHIDFTTVQISGQLAELNNNIKVQLGISQAILDKINEQGDKAEAFYNAVLKALANLGDENKAQFTALLNAIVKNGGKLDDITALLNAINKNITDGRKEAKEIGKQTVEAINKLGVNMSAGFAKVLAQGDTGIALMKEILKAIKNLNIGDGSKTEAYLQAILEAINGNTQELKDMTELLKTINNNVVQNGKDAKEIGEKILEAIKTLGTTTAEGFKALLEQGKLSLAKMDEILNAIKALDANTQANLKVIINSGKVNMDKILEFLAKIEKNGNETNVKLGDMNIKADTMIAGINEIIELLKKGLKDIEVKIEDHDVKVTVDVTGKVECKCTCDGHSPNEGIITELNNLFG